MSNKLTAMGKTSSAAIAAACTIGLLLTGFVPANSDTVNAADAVAAIEAVAPSAVAKSADTVAGDGVAAEAMIDDVRLSVPTNAAEGISVGEKVQIGLPFAAQASDAAASPASGVVAYDNRNGSTTVPIINEDGTLQIHTVLENANAPKRYDYPLDVPAGASLVRSPEGIIAVVAADGAPLMVFGDAWAKDANGKAVPTRYEVHDNTLTQVVETTAQTAFPVVADPATTGVYSYNCVNPNGSSYFLKPGEKLTNCKGSFLQKYINGKMVQSAKLTYGGGAGTKPPANAAGCILSLASGVALIFFPPTGALAWFVTGGLTAAGIVSSCVSW